MDAAELGRVAYKTYCNNVAGRSVQGEALPVWDDQLPKIKAAWAACAQAVAAVVTDSTRKEA
jgi:hypothetical protein